MLCRLSARTCRLALIPLLAAVLAACNEPPADASTAAPAPVPVSVVTLQPQAVALERELPGRTRAFVIAEVRPQVTGIVRERLFEEGAEVAAGDPLYQLDDATYRAAANSARASIERAEAALDLARRNAKRAVELQDVRAISEQEYQALLSARDQAEADLAVARAQYETALVRLNYALIKAPISGRTGRSSVTQGALVTADQADALTTIHQLDPVYVDVTQSASELLSLRRALSASAIREAEKIPVRILLDDGTPYPLQGELKFSDVAVDPTTGSVAMRVVVPNPDKLLLPGMYVRAVVSNAIVEDALLVPQRGIMRDAKGQATAMVVTADGTVEARAVSVDSTLGADWLVRDGLIAGDRVVVEGLQKIAPGTPVDAVEFGGDAG